MLQVTLLGDVTHTFAEKQDVHGVPPRVRSAVSGKAFL